MAEKALSLPLTTRDRHRGDLPHLQLTLTWGCVAECIVSILCPVSIVGVLDLSATALNVIGPFIAGAVHAFDESLNDTRWHRYWLRSGTLFATLPATTCSVLRLRHSCAQWLLVSKREASAVLSFS